MFELLAIGGTVAGALAAGMYIGRSKAEPVESEGCNGHHWGDPEPLVDPLRLGGRTDFDFAHVSVAEIAAHHVVLVTKGEKRCEDCGKTEQVTMQVGKIHLTEFVDESELDEQ